MSTKTHQASKVRATTPSYKIPAALRDAGNISGSSRCSVSGDIFLIRMEKRLLWNGNYRYPELHGRQCVPAHASTPPAWADGIRAIPQGGL